MNFDINAFIGKLETEKLIIPTRRASGAGYTRPYYKLIITEKIKKQNRLFLTNNYRRLHGLPLIRKGSTLYKFKKGQSF